MAIGGWLDKNNNGIVDPGEGATASANDSTAIGSGAFTNSLNGTALGEGAQADAQNSVALGGGSIANAADTVSVGSATLQRRITNVAAGINPTDAVNMSQLTATQAMARQAMNEATTAIASADSALVESSGSFHVLGQSAGANAPTQSLLQTGSGNAGDNATLVAANAHADAGDATTLAAANAYTSASSASTLSTANTYTDTRFANLSTTIDNLQSQMDDRFAQTDRRISRVGAMTSAMSNVAASAAGIRTPDRVAVSMGFLGGEEAMSLGYQHAFNDRMTLTISGAIAQGDTGGTIGFGYGW